MAQPVYPGHNASTQAHLQYFIDAMKHIAAQDPPPNYVQQAHAGNDTVGDIYKPSMLNCSYDYMGMTRVSFSVPSFLKISATGVDMDAEGNFKMNQGLTLPNLGDSLSVIMKASGIHVEGFNNGTNQGNAKIGPDKPRGTTYVEMHVDRDDYARAGAIMGIIVNSKDMTPQQVMENINRQNPAQAFSFSGLETIASTKGTYIDTQKMDPQQLDEVKRQLEQNGISVTEKMSSLNGGTKVLAVSLESEATFKALAAGGESKAVQSKFAAPRAVDLDLDLSAPVSNRFDKMSAPSLKDAIANDPTFLRTMKVEGRDVPLHQAIEDKKLRVHLISCMEAAQARGHDLKDQIALVQAYDGKMDAAAASVAAPVVSASVSRAAPRQ